jgi:hypothetical protein
VLTVEYLVARHFRPLKIVWLPTFVSLTFKICLLQKFLDALNILAELLKSVFFKKFLMRLIFGHHSTSALQYFGCFESKRGKDAKISFNGNSYISLILRDTFYSLWVDDWGRPATPKLKNFVILI